MKFYCNDKLSLFSGVFVLALSSASVQVEAVELSTDGVGDVLIMPYYTVRDVNDRNGSDAGKYQSFFNITNISSNTVAVQVKVREAQHGRLCGKLNVVLSPHDVWSAAIQDVDSGVRLFTADNSCTSPQMTPSGNGAELLLNTANFAGFLSDDSGPGTIDRCKEGFVEIISLGRSNKSTTAGTVANNAKHLNKQPKDCGAVRQAFSNASKFVEMKTEFKEPTNSLKGYYTLINFDNGISYGGDFVALSNFYSPDINNGEGADGSSENDLLPPPITFSDTPTLNSANPKESLVRIGSGLDSRTVIDSWDRGVDAVSAVLARSQTMNQWTTNPNLGAETAWVVTMPTSSFYTGSTSVPPFQETFAANVDRLGPLGLPSGGACSRVALNMYDRHENRLTTRFSPQNTGASPLLCYAVNPITFNGGNLMGSTIARNINTPNDQTKNGWLNLSLTAGSTRYNNGGGLGRPGSGSGSNSSDNIYAGLPVIATSFTIRTQGGAGKSFGSLWQNSYQRDIGKARIIPGSGGIDFGTIDLDTVDFNDILFQNPTPGPIGPVVIPGVINPTPNPVVPDDITNPTPIGPLIPGGITGGI